MRSRAKARSVQERRCGQAVADGRLAKDGIKKADCIAFEDLGMEAIRGMEAIWRREAEDFPAAIVIDDKGNDFFQELRLGWGGSLRFARSLSGSQTSYRTRQEHMLGFDNGAINRD